MSGVALTEGDIAKLTALAKALLPGTATMPAVDGIAGFTGLLRVAVRACGFADADLRAALDAMTPAMDFEAARAFAATRPDAFGIVSTLTSAAYYMAPAALAGLGYPTDRRHPAEVEDFVSEYETGILDAVSERGPIYRETRTTA